MFGPVYNLINCINGYEGLRVGFGNKIHQKGIFIFIYNGNNFCFGLIIIGAKPLINSSSAAQAAEDKFPDFLLMPGNNADPLFLSSFQR